MRYVRGHIEGVSLPRPRQSIARMPCMVCWLKVVQHITLECSKVKRGPVILLMHVPDSGIVRQQHARQLRLLHAIDQTNQRAVLFDRKYKSIYAVKVHLPLEAVGQRNFDCSRQRRSRHHANSLLLNQNRRLLLWNKHWILSHY